MRIITEVAVVLFVLFICGCGKSAVSNGAVPTTTVDVVRAVADTISMRRSFVGRVSGKYEATIQPRVSAYLLSRHFESGMPVKRGALLFVLDASLLTTTEMSARATLASARAQAVEAKNNYERAVPLSEINAISQSQLDQYTAQYKAAQANVQSAEQALRNARLEVSYCCIYSPIDGFVEAPQAHVGDYVGVGTAFSTLTKVVNVDTVSVDIVLPMSQYLRSEGLNVPIYANRELLSDITLLRDGGEIYPLKGIYDYTRTEVVDAAGTIAIVVDFPNPNYLLKAGQFARVEANVGPCQRKVIVPQQCVEQMQGQNSVWVIRPDSTAEYRKVILGSTYGRGWVIESGVLEGEWVVSSGAQKLRNGAKVLPREIE